MIKIKCLGNTDNNQCFLNAPQGCHDFSMVIVASRRKIGRGNALISISFIKNNALINIINDGYVICNNCNAGRIVKKSLINKVMNDFFGVKEEEIIDSISSYADYIKSINKMGDWYVDNVPTYQT